MLVVGAKGHAVEVLQCLGVIEHEHLVFFDDVTPDQPDTLFETYPVLRTPAQAQCYLASTDPRFALGLGGPHLRRRLVAQLQAWGGQLTSVIASTAVVSPFSTVGLGVNIMQHTLVSPTARLGEGVLLNAGAAVHHDSVVGDYCEIAPGARILGHCRIEQGCWIGASAVILPGVVVGRDAIIGAGAIVTRPVEAGTTVVGIPARLIG